MGEHLMITKENQSEIFRAEAIKALTEKPIVTYTAERVRLWSEIVSSTDDTLCQPLKMGGGMKKFLEKVSIPINENDLLIGRETEESFTAEEEKEFVGKYFIQGMRPEGIPLFMNDWGHQSFAWDDIIKEGLPDLRNKAERYLSDYRKNGSERQCHWLEGAIMVYDGFIRYLERSADAARNAGLSEAADVCENLAKGAPATFREALQLVYTIEFVFCAYIAPNPTLALGRLDLFLNDFYENDIRCGRLTDEEAGLLIDDFYAKNNLIMGRGEHQLSARNDNSKCTGWNRILCYDAPQYLILSGEDPDTGISVANGLTRLFVAHIEPKYKNPVIVFRYSKSFAENHPDIWRKLIEKMRSSASILLYNDIAACRMYIDRGETPHDARTLEYYGCNWPTLPGRDVNDYGYVWSGLSDPVGFEMQVLEKMRSDGEEFTRDGFLKNMHDAVYRRVKEFTAVRNPPPNGPNPDMLTVYCCFARGNIERAGRWFERVNILASISSIGSMVDIASAAENICVNRKIPLDRLLAACDNNFENDKVLLALCKNSPKLGDDDPLSSLYAEKLSNAISDAYDEALADLPSYCKLRICPESDTWHYERGAGLGATPDGRLKGQAISQNSQPSSGAAKNGITAMFNSLAHIPFYRFASGGMNVTIQTSTFAGESGLDNLARLFSVYLEKGGLQIQLSAVDRELLIDAQKNPDAHRDLMVRVTGYSAVFVDMSKISQDDFMTRNSF